MLNPIMNDLAHSLRVRGWFTSDELVPQDICEKLLQQLQIHRQNDSLKKAGIGQGNDLQTAPEVRGDFIHWLEPSDPSPLEFSFLRWMREFQQELNERLFFNLQSTEMHYAVYPPSAGYQKHLDVFKADNDRAISFVLYLNKSWQPEHGGELMIYSEDNPKLVETKVAPIFSQCVIFLSDKIYHQVNLTTAERFSVTGWLKKSAPALKVPLA